MDSDLVLECAQASFTGSLPFPQIVGKLIGTSVEYYHVNYVALQMTFYGTAGSVIQVPIPFNDLPAVSADFDAPALQKAILDSQVNGQKFHAFSVRAVQSGVHSYYAFLRGKRVTYLGRQGDQHIEWFPGSKPVEKNS